MPDIDIPQIINDIKAAASGVIQKDISTVNGFSQRQIKKIAEQTELVGKGILNGEITPATQDFFLDQLAEMARNFARTLVGLIVVTIEKIWNAIIGVIWGTISKISGVVLPKPPGS